jgi:DMSO reductase anchor subunit
MLRIFFLVFSQLTVGGLALMRLVPAAEIGKGFFRTCASIYLLIWLLVLAGLEWSRPWECLGFALFTLLFLVYYASLWGEWLPDSSRLLDITSLIGFGAVVASALSYSAGEFPTAEAGIHVANFLFSTLSLGSAMSGMLLGHWYLVTPELSLVPIKRLTGILVGSLIVQGALLVLTMSPELGAVPTALLPRVQMLLRVDPYFLLGRTLVGLVGTFGLAVLTMWLLQEGSTQAATGFLYTAVLTVTVGELMARFLFYVSSVPV